MYCLFVLCASFFICQVRAEAAPVEKIIKDYFNSESVRKFRKEWEKHRKPLEHAILTALKETVAVPGMNVYIKNLNRNNKEKIAAGYFHNDNQVQLILSELGLEETPRCWLPEVQLSLASNVLKIQTSLSKMIIHADYTLVRNRADIIHEPKDQDQLRSPFLFESVQDVGKVAITMEDCTLSGFIMTILNGESVDLGYHHFKFLNCLNTIEIYSPGANSPPVIAKYNPCRDDDDEHGLCLPHLLMKPLLTDELVPKLQAAMYSFVNTSAIFGKALQEYRENQETVFQTTAQHFTELIRNLNRITVKKNNGAIEMKEYVMHWDDGKIKPSDKHSGESVKLMHMVLTGLDTMYSAHCGGPFKIETIMMADEIRFSSLQVRGEIEIKSKWSDTFSFAAEINDMVVDLQQSQENKGNSKDSKKDPGFKKLEVTGLRRMIFMVPTQIIFSSAESFVSGYLMNEVPKLLRSHLLAILPEALQKKNVPPRNKAADNVASEIINNHDDEIEDNVMPTSDPKSESDLKSSDTQSESDLKSSDTQSESDRKPSDKQSESDSLSELMQITDSEDRDYHELEGKREREIFRKTKKHFKSVNRPRRLRLRHYGTRKRVADNQIRKK